MAPHSQRNRLLAGTVVLFVARLAISLLRSGPVLVADEIGYLTNARVIVGGLPGQFDLAPFYKGGYSVLLAPIVGAFPDPSASYHLALALNAALAASVFPLLYLLLTRYLAVAPRVAIWASFAGALYPAVTVLSQVAMTENALFPLVCLWLIGWGGLLAARSESGALRWALFLGASTGALWAVHNRMAVAIALTVVLLGWLAARRRISASALAMALAAVGAVALGSHLLDAFLADRNYGGGVADEADARLSALSSGHAMLTVAGNLVGQLWYAIAATFGLLIVVAADTLERLRSGRSLHAVTPILLGLTALLLLVSAAAFPERTRPDMLVYGRYAEIVSPAVVAIGVALLAAGRVRARIAGPMLGFGLLAAAVVLVRVTASDPGAANRWNVSSLPFLTFELGPAVLVGATLVAAAGAVVLVWAGARRPAIAPALAAAFLLAVVAYGLWNPVRSSERSAYPSGWTSPEPAAARYGIDRVAYDVDHYDALGLYPLQWFLPDTEVLTFHGDRGRPPSRYVISNGSWNDRHPARPGRPVWRDVGRDQVLWRLRVPSSAGSSRLPPR